MGMKYNTVYCITVNVLLQMLIIHWVQEEQRELVERDQITLIL